MKAFIDKLRNKSVHTPKLAIVRFLLALSLLMYLLFNDMNVVANHSYEGLPGYKSRHNTHAGVPYTKANLFMLMPPQAARGVVIIILLLVMSGLAPQVTGVLHVWACFSVRNYFLILNGGEQIGLILVVLLLPLCFTDPRINQWKQATPASSRTNIFANVAFFAIQLQAAIVYLYSAVSKLAVREWQEGTAVYYCTSHYRLGAPGWLRGINEIVTLSPFVALLSWGIILFELLLFVCLFAPVHIKRIFLVAGLAFHFMIIINFGLITFFISMAALLILYLDDANDSVRLLHKVFRTGKTEGLQL